MSLLRKRAIDAGDRCLTHVIPAKAGMTAGAVLPKSLRGIAIVILRGAERLPRSARSDMQIRELAIVADGVNILTENLRIEGQGRCVDDSFKKH
ncbi:MAG: hypothetical protein V3R87_11945 [Dehalococcoidia bacterium]